jgi:hypothetical protein
MCRGEYIADDGEAESVGVPRPETSGSVMKGLTEALEEKAVGDVKGMELAQALPRMAACNRAAKNSWTATTSRAVMVRKPNPP